MRIRAVWPALALAFLMAVVPAFAGGPVAYLSAGDVEQEIFTLFYQVSALQTSDDPVGFGERTSLVVKLVTAARAVERGDYGAAAAKMDAFVNEIGALEQSGRLDAADAEPFVTSANTIIGELQTL